MVGDRPLCKTPCERWLDPAIPYTLKYNPGFFQRNQFIDVPDLRAHQATERVEVRAEPRNMGEFVSGIMLTSLGGIAVLAGTALSAMAAPREDRPVHRRSHYIARRYFGGASRRLDDPRQQRHRADRTHGAAIAARRPLTFFARRLPRDDGGSGGGAAPFLRPRLRPRS